MTGQQGRDRPIRTALRFNNPTDEQLTFARQLGVEDVVVHLLCLSYLGDDELVLPDDRAWTFEELVQVRSHVEDAGLRLAAIENFPAPFYEDVMLDGPARET